MRHKIAIGVGLGLLGISMFLFTAQAQTESEVLIIALGEQNESGQTGWATLTAKGDQTEVVLNVLPGDLESELVHIHSGSCGADTLGGVVHGLTNIAGGVSVSTVDAPLSSLRTGGFAINSHQKGEPSVYTTCGNIPKAAEALTLPLGGRYGASGFATLSARGGKTEVVLTLSPGILESELVHIHSGQCATFGHGSGLVHRLNDITSGASATVLDVSLASLRAQDLAIAAHWKRYPIVETACGDIPAGEQDVLQVALGEQNESGQTGWATLTAKGDHTEVVLNVLPGDLESELVHIHSGSCGADTLGGVVYGLTNIADGVSVTTVGARLSSLRTGGFAINSHQKGEPSVYTTCGNIPTEADALTIALNEQNDSGQSGFVTLTGRGSKIEVVLALSPGALESELVHIHSGQCGDSLGGVEFGLTNIVGGASVTTVDTSLSSLLTGGFAVNAHQKDEPGVYTACGNIPAGPVEVLQVALGEQNESARRDGLRSPPKATTPKSC